MSTFFERFNDVQSNLSDLAASEDDAEAQLDAADDFFNSVDSLLLLTTDDDALPNDVEVTALLAPPSTFLSLLLSTVSSLTSIPAREHVAAAIQNLSSDSRFSPFMVASVPSPSADSSFVDGLLSALPSHSGSTLIHLASTIRELSEKHDIFSEVFCSSVAQLLEVGGSVTTHLSGACSALAAFDKNRLPLFSDAPLVAALSKIVASTSAGGAAIEAREFACMFFASAASHGAVAKALATARKGGERDGLLQALKLYDSKEAEASRYAHITLDFVHCKVDALISGDDDDDEEEEEREEGKEEEEEDSEEVKEVKEEEEQKGDEEVGEIAESMGKL